MQVFRPQSWKRFYSKRVTDSKKGHWPCLDTDFNFAREKKKKGRGHMGGVGGVGAPTCANEK